MFNKVVSLFLVTVIGLSCVGCGIKVEPDVTTPQDIKTTQSTQLPDLETHDVEPVTQEATEQTESTESEEKTMLDTTDIKNLNEMTQEISKDINGSIGYLLNYAKEKGYQNFALLVSNKALYDEELCSKLEKLDAPFMTNFCLLAQNVDNEYSYFRYKYNEVSKLLEIEEEPLLENTKEKQIETIGYIEEYNLMYTEIVSKDNTFEVFSNASGKIAVRNKLDVTTYIDGIDDGISTSFTTFSKTYDKYLNSMKKIEFSKDMDNLKSY